MAKSLTQFTEPPLTDNDDLQKAIPRKPINMRTVVENVFSEIGGEQGMVEWVKKSTANERIFYRDMIPKLIPKEENHTVTNNGSIDIRHHLNLRLLSDDELKQLEVITAKCVNEQ